MVSCRFDKIETTRKGGKNNGTINPDEPSGQMALHDYGNFQVLIRIVTFSKYLT